MRRRIVIFAGLAALVLAPERSAGQQTQSKIPRVGVLTVAPRDPDTSSQTGASWLGSPAMRLPRRQESAPFGEERTFRPTRKIFAQRALFELLRIALPGAGATLTVVSILEASLALWQHAGPAGMLALLPFIYCAIGLIALLGVAAVKWLTVGRYRPFAHPVWSPFVWRLEFVNALYEFFAIDMILDALQGTPFIAWYLRLLGARIGRDTCINTVGFVEWDLVEIGDGAVLDEDCVLQTHLFEDRVLKGSHIRIGARCEVGQDSVILYDTALEDGARIGSLSLVMKGESVTAGRQWVGSPISDGAMAAA